MRTWVVFGFCLTVLGLQLPSSAHAAKPGAFIMAQEGIRPVAAWQLAATETSRLEAAFSNAVFFAANVQPGPDAGAQRRALDSELRAELTSFLTDNPNSAYAPGVHLWLARRAALRCGYSTALDEYRLAFDASAGVQDFAAQTVALQASGGLARMLALTGRLAEFDALEAAMKRAGLPEATSDWRWALEMRTWVGKHPEQAYKCGLYCLDQLGRFTQPGQFLLRTSPKPFPRPTASPPPTCLTSAVKSASSSMPRC